MKSFKFYIAILIFAFCIFNFFGCANLTRKFKSRPSTGSLEPQAIGKFSDIPVPSGFKLLPEDSYAFESVNLRVAVLKYQGKASPDQVVDFYKEQMLMYNWNLLNIIEYGQRLMNFDRDTETCIITLEPKGSGTLITISIGPKSQVRKKSEKPLK